LFKFPTIFYNPGGQLVFPTMKAGKTAGKTGSLRLSHGVKIGEN
jgi:hypothetical protein